MRENARLLEFLENEAQKRKPMLEVEKQLKARIAVDATLFQQSQIGLVQQLGLRLHTLLDDNQVSSFSELVETDGIFDIRKRDERIRFSLPRKEDSCVLAIDQTASNYHVIYHPAKASEHLRKLKVVAQIPEGFIVNPYYLGVNIRLDAAKKPRSSTLVLIQNSDRQRLLLPILRESGLDRVYVSMGKILEEGVALVPRPSGLQKGWQFFGRESKGKPTK